MNVAVRSRCAVAGEEQQKRIVFSNVGEIGQRLQVSVPVGLLVGEQGDVLRQVAAQLFVRQNASNPVRVICGH